MPLANLHYFFISAHLLKKNFYNYKHVHRVVVVRDEHNLSVRDSQDPPIVRSVLQSLPQPRRSYFQRAAALILLQRFQVHGVPIQ